MYGHRVIKPRSAFSGRKAALFFLCAFLSGAVAVPDAHASLAHPVNGYCGINNCSKSVVFNTQKIIELLKNDIIKYIDNDIRKAINIPTAAYIKTSAGLVEAWLRLTQAQIDNKFTLAVAKAGAYEAIDKAVTIPGSNLLCHVVRTNQVEQITKQYADALGDFLSRRTYDFSFGKDSAMTESLDGKKIYKCIGPEAGHGDKAECNIGMGQQELMRAKCFLGTWSPEDYSDSSKNTWLCSNSGFSNADALDPVMRLADARMDTIFSSLEFVSPDASSSPLTKGVSKEKRKKLFLAAINYCYSIYGFPSERPIGVDAKADMRLSETVNFDALEAQQFPVLQRCLQVVAEHTKPDCKNPANDSIKDLCALQKKVCNNAMAHGVDVSMFVDDVNATDGCPSDQGLSYAEIRQISQEGCLTNQEYVDLAATTTSSQAGLAVAARKCEESVAAYRVNLKKEKERFAAIAIKKRQTSAPVAVSNDSKCGAADKVKGLFDFLQ